MDGGGAVKIDVFWVAPEEDWITRGYADCGFLEAMLRNEQWRPQQPLEFVNWDVRKDIPHYDGAVVCFSGLGLAPHADWIISEIDKMEWALVVICGNECWDFPWERLPETDRRRVWVMNPLPEHAHLSNRIPGGPYPNTREEIAPHAAIAANRRHDWFFGVQVTNERRRSCVRALHGTPNGDMIQTDRFMGGVPSAEWAQRMVNAKMIPCPSGPMTLDANRPLAALEAGCVPILDMRKPQDPQFDYWQLVFGDYPMPVVFDWPTELQSVMDRYLKNWVAESNTMFAWWQQWKRRNICLLHDTVRDLSGHDQGPAAPDERITAIITSSPIPSHPDTSILEQTVASVREQLPHAEIIIVFDGVRPEQQHLRGPYDEYVRRVLWKCNFEWENVLPVVMPAWGHQANATRHALTFVRTDTILFMEHDTPIIGDIPWDGLITQIELTTANVIRLHQDVDIHPDHERVMLDPEPRIIDGLPLRRTAAWWQRPHLAATDFYRTMLDRHFHPESRTMIEDRVYGIMWVDCADNRRGWDRWRVWIYQPAGDMRRSGHLDGRGDEPKFDMLFAPDGSAK